MRNLRKNTSPSSNDSADAHQESLRLWVQRHKEVLALLLDAYCVVDTANRVVAFNTAFSDLCGHFFKRVLAISKFCDLLSTEACPDNCPAHRILRTERPLRLDEITAKTAAFDELRIILSGVPIFDANRKIAGAALTIRNVSAESELQRKYYDRKRESIVDGLTKLYNKVFTESELVRRIQTSYRQGTPVSVVLCDIDHFKKVNDTYGHRAGDHVLSAVAQLLREEGRDTDVMGRVGGEEFMAILWNTDRLGAYVFAERFRATVEKYSIRFEGKDIPVTISQGTASFSEKWHQSANPERTARELTAAADRALYQAKREGRNRVVQSDDQPPKRASNE